MSTGMIFNLQKFSLHDGPGIRTTVFFKGCPLQCWWCHNPESQAPGRELMIRAERCIGCGECARNCPHGAIGNGPGGLATRREKCAVCGACAVVCGPQARVMTGREETVAAVLAEIEKDLVFYDESGGGVTFSGGEPLSQPGFLLELLMACRERGIHTAVDTCGFASRDTLLGIAGAADLFLYDLKVMDRARHERYTGVSNELILDNLGALAEKHPAVAVRIPLIPGVNDDAKNIMETGRFLSRVPNIRQVTVLPYHPTGMAKYAGLGKVYRLGDTAPPPQQVVDRARRILQGCGLTVSIGGS